MERRDFLIYVGQGTVLSGLSLKLAGCLPVGDDSQLTDGGSGGSGSGDSGSGTGSSGTGSAGDGGTGSGTGTGTGSGTGTSAMCEPNITMDLHTHAVTVPSADVDAGTEKTYDLATTNMHTHTVTVTAADFTELKTNDTVTVMSVADTTGHQHSITITCA